MISCMILFFYLSYYLDESLFVIELKSCVCGFGVLDLIAYACIKFGRIQMVS